MYWDDSSTFGNSYRVYFHGPSVFLQCRCIAYHTLAVSHWPGVTGMLRALLVPPMSSTL